MLSFEPNIVIVDDKKDEVIGLLENYRDEGIGTKFYNASIFDGDDKPQEPFSGVNLIFLDLYYSSDFDVELCTSWIEKLIPENSFYVLVIWSKDTDHAGEVLDELKDINRVPYLPLVIQKGEKFKNLDNTWNFEKLSDFIQNEIDKHAALEELSIWKKSINNSSNLIIGHLADPLLQNSLDSKLQKIILGHGGKTYISDDKHEQKREILFEALDDVLISNSKSQRPDTVISEDNKTQLYNTLNVPVAEVDSKLNSWFHFKLLKFPLCQTSVKPGVISTFKESSKRGSLLKKIYGDLIIDENIKTYLKKQLIKSNLLGSNTKIIDVVLLLSRPCDIAQGKYGRNLKLISGVKIVNPDRKENERKELKTGNKFDSIKLFDHLHFNEEENDVALIFDYRYIFSVPEDIYLSCFENIKVFNKDLLSELQVEYSSYSSRLGITQII